MDEAIIALENVSGSPITNEGHDLMASLYKADGGLMVGGVGFFHHLTSAAQAGDAPPRTDPGPGRKAHPRDVRRRSRNRRGRRFLLERLVHGGAAPAGRLSHLAD